MKSRTTLRFGALALTILLVLADVRSAAAQEPPPPPPPPPPPTEAEVIIAVDTALPGTRLALYWIIILNQGSQLQRQLQSINQLRTNLTQQVRQYTQLRAKAMGLVGPLVAPIRDLMALPSELLSETRSWAGDFTGDARDLVDKVTDMGSGTSFRESWQTALDDARTVTAASVRDSYADRPADVAEAAVVAWQDQEGQADARLVLTNVRADAAAAVAATVLSAQGRLDTLANANPATDTALQQAVLASTISRAQMLTAMTQMDGWDISEQAAHNYQTEIGRRERDAEDLADRIAAAAALQTQLQAIEAQRANRQRGLELRLHPMYGGN